MFFKNQFEVDSLDHHKKHNRKQNKEKKNPKSSNLKVPAVIERS